MAHSLRQIQLYFIAYANYIVFFLTGLCRDLFERFFGGKKTKAEPGYVPTLNDFGAFFVRRFFKRGDDCFARVVTSNAGAYMDVKTRIKEDNLGQQLVSTDEVTRVMNLGSYNYLGFGDPDEYCTPLCKQVLDQYGASTASVRVDIGTTQVHRDLEKVTAWFLGVEDAIVYGMGWATNATTIPALISKGDLFISDALNHNSIITGARASGATVKVFKHNNLENLEKILRQSIIEGQPRTHTPWRKIIVAVEGIYSMEGELCPLPQIVELKKKYKFYIWLDEAHSIGCMGSHGGGVCEHTGVDTKEIEFLMGTFTKSFGAAGGYVAGSKKVIDWIRLHSFGHVYADSMPAPVAQQAMRVLQLLKEHPEGKRRLDMLHENAVWFRDELKKRKFYVLGESGSPVVPIIIPPFALLIRVSRETLKRKLGLVIVSFPAVDILQGRVRICLNSVHTREELQKAIDIIEECVKDLPVKLE